MAMRGSLPKRELLLTSVAVAPAALAVAGHLYAADLGLKKMPAEVVPPLAYSWTGCFAGAHVGWGFSGHQDLTETFATRLTIPTASSGLDSSGGVFGGQLGCNYQFGGNWVAGVQGDFAGTDLNGTGNDPLNAELFENATIGVKTDWLASVTGRLGLTGWNNQALFYIKGGAAWDHNQWDFHNSNNALAGATPPLFPGENRTGWTLGGGIEYLLTPSWSVFAEFNYYNFSNGTTFLVPSGSSITPAGAMVTGKQEIDIVKVGANYKFYGP